MLKHLRDEMLRESNRGGEREVGPSATYEEAEPAPMTLGGSVKGLRVQRDQLVVRVERGVAFADDCAELGIVRGGFSGECSDLLF